MSHDVLAEKGTKAEPVTSLKFTEWANKYWPFMMGIGGIVFPVITLWLTSFIGSVGVSKAEFSSYQKEINDLNKSRAEMMHTVERTTQLTIDQNAKQDIAIGQLQTTVGDIKDDIKDIKSGQNELLRRIK